MTKPTETIHVHVWVADEDKWDDEDGFEDLDATYRDTYDDPDGYHQYGVTRSNGEYLEIRIPLNQE